MDKENTLLGFSVPSASPVFWAITGTILYSALAQLRNVVYEKLTKNFQMTQNLFLTTVEFIGISLTAIPTLIRILTKKQQIQAKLYHYFIISLMVFASKTLANCSMLRVGITTANLFKATRLVPTLIANISILETSPSVLNVASLTLIVAGLVAFAIFDFTGNTRYDVVGVTSVIFHIFLDSYISNFIEKLFSRKHVNQQELISLVYPMAEAFSFASTISSGQFFTAFAKIGSNPVLIKYIVLLGLTSALSAQVLIFLIKTFGAITTCLIASLRAPIVSLVLKSGSSKMRIPSLIVVLVGIFARFAACFFDEKEPDFGQYAQNDSNFNKAVDFQPAKEIENGEEEDVNSPSDHDVIKENV